MPTTHSSPRWVLPSPYPPTPTTHHRRAPQWLRGEVCYIWCPFWYPWKKSSSHRVKTIGDGGPAWGVCWLSALTVGSVPNLRGGSEVAVGPLSIFHGGAACPMGEADSGSGGLRGAVEATVWHDVSFLATQPSPAVRESSTHAFSFLSFLLKLILYFVSNKFGSDGYD